MSAIHPVVAIVGRPNVGKSTLFNRLLGQRRSIVHDMPGVTRDRLQGRLELANGLAVDLVDTGGLVVGDDPLGLGVQVMAAIRESDLVLFLVDGAAGLLPGDQEIAARLRTLDRSVLLVVNKADVREARESAMAEFSSMGFSQPMLVSSEHGTGVGALSEAIAGFFPPPAGTGVGAGAGTEAGGRGMPDAGSAPEESPEESSDVSKTEPAIAIVGRPNVGKSSLLNRLVGAERALVSPVAGTTRDPVDTVVEREGKRYRLVDTAGIRRRSQATDAPEELAVLFARRAAERADLCVLVVDAVSGVTSGDLGIAGVLWESGKTVVVAVNKWDLLDEKSRERLDQAWPRLAEVLADPERINISCTTGRGLERFFPRLEAALAGSRRQVPTARLNDILEKAVKRHPAPAGKKRPWKLFYATQVGHAPPTFMLFVNRGLGKRDSYRRYLENQLREALGLAGVPIRLVMRRRSEASSRS